MTIARETVYAALFTKLQTLVPTILTVSRRLRHLQEVDEALFPACYQIQSYEDILHIVNMPPIYTFRLEWWLYTLNADPNGTPSTQLNNLIDVIESALTPDYAGVLTQTLQKQVHRVWIAGPIDVYEGLILDRALAIIPIHVTIAGS